jgi:anti-sigma-K factor RskA
VDASRFISSGLIEAYVSGLATSNEIQELERGMTQYPEVAAAVNDCQLDMEQYVTLQSKTPPAELKQRIFHIIINEEAARESGAFTESETEEFPETKVYVSSSWRWIAVAAILLLLGSLLLNYVFYGSINNYKGRYEALLSTNNTLASESNLYKTRMEEMAHSMDLVKDPSMKTVKMPGTKPFPSALATLYWNQQSKEVFIMVNNLPEPAADKQYQLWAIVGGKPVDMGVFEMGDHHELLQKMKSIDSAEMFAITLEKKGGSPVPTFDQMYVAGKAS